MRFFAPLYQKMMQNKARTILYGFAALAIITMFAGAAVLRYLFNDLPSISQLETYTPSLTSRVYDVNKNLIAEFAEERRALLPLNKIPVDMQNAVLATEDHIFFEHWGVSPKGIMRALMRDILHRRAAQGGSTLTQQLTKLVFLTREKTISRKIREVVLAMQIEHDYSKQEILQMYLNQIYFGRGAYGVAAAAKTYYGKDIKNLTLAECAMLAGLISSPDRFNPFKHPDEARQRRNVVLIRMLTEGFITKDEMETARKEPLPKVKPDYVSAQAPYFVEYVRQMLEPKYGYQMLWKGGLKIYTTLDMRYQKAAEEIMERNLAKLDAGVEEDMTKRKISKDPDSFKLQGAFVAMDIKTGAILVMIGGRDYKETKFNRATQARRQPGSSFKPFVWMSALLNGYTPASTVEDSPLAFYYDGRDWRLFEGATDQYSIGLATQPFVGNKDFRIWVPTNFGGKSSGKTTLRIALEKSLNLASIHLTEKIGPSVVIETARKAGVKSKLDPVLALGLGTSAIPMIEMVNGLSTFANNGIHTEPLSVLRVEDAKGRILEENTPVEKEVFAPQPCFLLINMMRGVVERGTGHNAKSLNRPIAGKTGTSQDHRDMWFIGMTPDIAAGAWMGYDDFSTLEYKDWTGGSTVVPWWTEIMAQILKDQPVKDFPVPDGISFVMIDPATGKLALPTSKSKLLEAFIKGTEPKTFSTTSKEAEAD